LLFPSFSVCLMRHDTYLGCRCRRTRTPIAVSRVTQGSRCHSLLRCFFDLYYCLGLEPDMSKMTRRTPSIFCFEPWQGGIQTNNAWRLRFADGDRLEHVEQKDGQHKRSV
jgi:hypothetical protein